MLPTVLIIVAAWAFLSVASGVALGTSIRRLRDRPDVVPPARWTMRPAGLVVRTTTLPPPRPRRR
ncbi:MAG TPA: hypothetical protein VHT75_17610 [Acidimicrobiales bacterium]|jgi:hypothetical protein|nr:hypothetical protein [Acidimicrobiales bacterium]